MQAALTTHLQYAPPGGSVLDIVTQLTGVTYTILLEGVCKIPNTTLANTTFKLLGAADAPAMEHAKVVVIRNRQNTKSIGLRLNGEPVSPAVLCQIPPGGEVILGGGTPTAVPVTQVAVDTMALQDSDGEVDFWLLG